MSILIGHKSFEFWNRKSAFNKYEIIPNDQ